MTPLPAAEAVAGRPLPAWERGMLDIHQINTGTGDAALFIFPDGTTFLLDAGAVNRTAERPPNYDAPPRPDASRRPGQWIARYIRRVHPEGERGALDYAALTHFHGDHMGTLTPDAPWSASGAYQLTGITDVGDEIQIRTLLDRDWPDYNYPAPSGSAMMRNYRAFLKWQIEHRGLKVERFTAGRADQVVLRRAPREFPGFEVRNIAANGHVWTGAGTEARNRFPQGILPVENNCSLAFRLTYGAFRYFNGGDMAGFLAPNGPAWAEMESAVAWVTGPVDAYALNHHGTRDSANAFFLSVLQPRVHILSTYASSQPSPDVMRRMLAERIYPGPRDIFMTNHLWPGRREHMVKLFGEDETAWLLERMGQVAASQGHVLLRVEPGGARYRVIVIDDRADAGNVLSVHGPYPSRGAPAAGGASRFLATAIRVVGRVVAPDAFGVAPKAFGVQPGGRSARNLQAFATDPAPNSTSSSGTGGRMHALYGSQDGCRYTGLCPAVQKTEMRRPPVCLEKTAGQRGEGG